MRIAILVGRAAIHDDIRDTTLCRKQRKGSRRIDGQSGTEGYDQVTFVRGVSSAREVLRLQTLAKADRGRLEKTAALAHRWFARAPKVVERRCRISAPAAARAF